MEETRTWEMQQDDPRDAMLDFDVQLEAGEDELPFDIPRD